MTQKLLRIRRALISVSDKSKILELSNALSQYNIQLLASEGTAKQLLTSGLNVLKISEYVNFPEIMDKRLKTLHTKIYAGILARPEIDNEIIERYSIKPINMVIANFYPYNSITYEKSNDIQNNDINLMTECIDIGGPSIIRAAAKNYENVVVIVNHNDYENIINELNNNHGKISIKTRLKLAAKAFQYVTTYDNLIANNFTKIVNKKKHLNNHKHNKKKHIHFPDYTTFMNVHYIKKENMRYGENPHQSAAFYVETQKLQKNCISTTKQLQGKKLSYNNILDSDTALECVKMFIKPTCVIVKHGNPCGVASNNNILHAYKNAYQTDPTSSFGGIIALNRNIDEKTAQKIIKQQQFIEIIILPYVNHNVLKIFNNKKNMRVLTYGLLQTPVKQPILNIDLKMVTGGLLIQNKDTEIINENNLEIVTKRKPTNQEMIDALFCWKIVKFSKSNAIVYGRNEQTVGIGAGQTSRIDAAKIANIKARNEGFNLQHTTMASDAFLPFPDTIDIASEIGVTCIIQPGGGIRDKQIIDNANEKNISMIFTHMRHFRH